MLLHNWACEKICHNKSLCFFILLPILTLTDNKKGFLSNDSQHNCKNEVEVPETNNQSAPVITNYELYIILSHHPHPLFKTFNVVTQFILCF